MWTVTTPATARTMMCMIPSMAVALLVVMIVTSVTQGIIGTLERGLDMDVRLVGTRKL